VVLKTQNKTLRLSKLLPITVPKQPSETTCGPTCLYATYQYYGHKTDLDSVIREVRVLDEGGTLGVAIGLHALDAGFKVSICNYNLALFDPTWFSLESRDLIEKLRSQRDVKAKSKLQLASEYYIEFLEKGGRVFHQELSGKLIARAISHGIPVLTGLSATYLYQTSREIGDDCRSDDIYGEPQGHFVVISGYDLKKKTLKISDPFKGNPHGGTQDYNLPSRRVLSSILLGIVTYDANLLFIEPRE